MKIDISEEEKSILVFYRALHDDQKITFIHFMESLHRFIHRDEECDRK